MKEGADLHALADVQEADALRPVQLVAAGAHHINIAGIHINGHLAKGLHGVCMEEDAMLPGNPADFRYRLNGADFIVGKHNRNQDGGGADGFFQFIQLHNPKLIHIQIRHLKPLLLQPLAGVQHGMVLNLAGDDVVPLGPIGLCGRLDRPVI